MLYNLAMQKRKLCIITCGKVKDVGIAKEELYIFSQHFQEIHVISYDPFQFNDFKMDKNVYVHTIPLWLLQNVILSTLLTQVLFSVVLLKICIKQRIDLIRAQDAVVSGLPSLIVGKLLRIPVTVISAGFPREIAHHRMAASRVSRFTAKFASLIVEAVTYLTLPLVDWVLAVGPKTVCHSKKHGAANVTQTGIPINNVFFNVPCAAHKDGQRRIVYIGRLDPGKGLDCLLKAATAFRNENIEFVIAGEGSEEKKLKKMIAKLALQDSVRLIGSIPHQNVPKLLENSDIFVLPSLTEGTPVALLEAMACGKPTITTRVGDIPLLFKDGFHTLIIPPNDAETLSKSIRLLLNDKNLASWIAENGRGYVENRFDKQRYVVSQLRVFHCLLSKRRLDTTGV